jgi:GTP-binding protein
MEKLRSVEFIKSSESQANCPKLCLPEFAFIGRSNVGKSSLINMLTGLKNLAKTSSNPGKTRLINHFLVDKKWYLVDLPGYGYARISKTDREKFDKLITEYILNREKLVCLFVLIDSRLEPQKNDLEFITWLGTKQIPFVLVFTKTDKLSDNAVLQNVNLFKKTLLENWELLPEIFFSSIVKKTGQKEILDFIDKTIKIIKDSSK